MNPVEKGWLKKYLDMNKKQILEEDEKQTMLSNYSSEEEMLYAILQPTGVLYGHPVKFPHLQYNEIAKWEDKDKAKVLLADSFIGSTYRFFEKDVKSEKDSEEINRMLVKQVSDYYLEIFPHLIKDSAKKRLSRKKQENEFTESIINNRIELKRKLDKNFWTSFFQNSLLFLDIYYFNQWINPAHLISHDDIHQQHDDIRLCVLEIIAAAAHANEVVELEERNLYDYFLQSCQLPSEKEKEAAQYIEEGMNLKDIDLTKWKDSWLLKKYLLELAILTVWSDQDVHEKEDEFINELGAKLDFSDEDIESSKIAIESFVMNNYEQVHYLQEKQNYKIVAQRFNRSMKKMLNFYKNSIVQEAKESKELVYLLNKSTKEGLSLEEKEKVRLQLLDVLKTLPIFALIALPGRTLTLPILFKVLPKNVLPSAFQN